VTAEKQRAAEKIQKLLALAKRPGTPAEGERAMERAVKIAGIHGLTIRKAQPKPDDIFGNGDWFNAYSSNVDRTAAERAARRYTTERKRKATTYRNAYNRGWEAAWNGWESWQNPYDKHVWGVNLPGAWRHGWWAYHDGKPKA
jgi:hypothetical protein